MALAFVETSKWDVGSAGVGRGGGLSSTAVPALASVAPEILISLGRDRAQASLLFQEYSWGFSQVEIAALDGGNASGGGKV